MLYDPNPGAGYPTYMRGEKRVSTMLLRFGGADWCCEHALVCDTTNTVVLQTITIYIVWLVYSEISTCIGLQYMCRPFIGHFTDDFVPRPLQLEICNNC